MIEKFVYLVTPDYMLPVIEESKLYSFFIKAYPNAKSGYNNLISTNLSSILGFVFLYEELPEDLTYLVKFINFLNVIGNKKTLVVLAVNNPDGVKDYLLRKIRTDNIVFKYTTEFEIVTDSFIKRSIFGSIVLHNFDPYVESINVLKEITTFNSNEALTPILPNDILQILSPVVKLNNSDNTIKHDIVMNSVKDNGLLMYMRINYIKASFGDEIDVKGMHSRVDAIEGLNKIVYGSVINIINNLFIANSESPNRNPSKFDSINLDESLEISSGISPLEPKEIEFKNEGYPNINSFENKEVHDFNSDESLENSNVKSPLEPECIEGLNGFNVKEFNAEESDLREVAIDLNDQVDLNDLSDLDEEDLFDYENMYNFEDEEI